MLKIFLLSVRWFIRDVKMKEWNSVLITLVLCISCIHAFELISDRLVGGIQHQSVEFLGGDLLVSSPEPLPKNWIEHAHALDVQTAEVWSYLSMLSRGEKLQLVNVYAVSQQFPLYGQHLPWSPFTMYVDPKLIELQTTPPSFVAQLGSKPFTLRPAKPTDFHFSNGIPLAPFVYVRMDDARLTNTISTNSRMDYLLFLKGTKRNIAEFQTWLRPQLTLSQKIIDPENQQSILFTIMHRFSEYLRYTLLIVIALSSISITLSFSYKQPYLNEKFAVWFAVGANKKTVRQLMVMQFLYIFLISNLVAIAIAFFIQKYALIAFKQYINFIPAPFAYTSLLIGSVSSVILLLGIIVPTMQLINQKTIGTFWKNLPQQAKRMLRFAPFIVLCNLIGFQLLHPGYSQLNVIITFILFCMIILLAACMRLFLMVSGSIADQCTGHWRFALKQFSSFPELTILHLSSLIFALFPLIFLFFAKHQLIQDWMQQLPKNTPNFFLFNLSKEDLPALKNLLEQQRIYPDAIYPMVKGRLYALNNKPILQAIPESGRKHNALKRDLNLSSMLVYPADNVMVEGHPWTKRDINKPLISIEKKLAEAMQVHVGDRLSFMINNEVIEATINTIRTVNWTSFHPNFFVIFTPGQLDRFPTTYITSFYLHPTQYKLTKIFSQHFPNATLIDISYVIQQVQTIINQLSFILNTIFAFSVLIAIVITWSCHLIVRQQRSQTIRIASLLGASKRFLHNTKRIERSISVGIVAIFSIVFSTLLYQVIVWSVFK